MSRRIVLFIFAFLIWILLSWKVTYQDLLVGVFVSAFVAFMIGDMFVQRPHVFSHPERYFWFMVYVPVLLWECIKANVDVAYRVTHPRRPINPGIVKVKTSLRSDTGLTFLANSITLTPGTLSVDINQEKGCLYIHWIDVKSKDIEAASERIVKRFERILEKVFE